MARELSGRVIVITGASSGIGAATAVACAQAGMDVVLTARREDRLAATAAAVAATGRKAEIVAGDIVEEGHGDRLLDAAESAFGGFHAVFANAGFGMEKPVVEMTSTEARRMFDVNFFSAVELLRGAAARLRDAGGGGHLLMCSSCVSKFALPGHGMYAATKAAQHMVCGAMRHELRRAGIDVSSVHPVTTTTELFEVSARLSGREPRPDGGSGHTPRLFVHSPERVAREVVRCLRRPRPEVWTSMTVRTVAALMTLSPRFYDLVMRRMPGT
jgi:short-subunit dehydrogenase